MAQRRGRVDPITCRGFLLLHPIVVWRQGVLWVAAVNVAASEREKHLGSRESEPPSSLRALVQEFLQQQALLIQQQRELLGLMQMLVEQEMKRDERAEEDDPDAPKKFLDGTLQP